MLLQIFISYKSPNLQISYKTTPVSFLTLHTSSSNDPRFYSMCSYPAFYSLFLIQLFLRSSYYYLFPIQLVPVFLSNTLCFLSDSSCFHPAILCFLSNYSLFPILLDPVSYPYTTLCFLSNYSVFPILLFLVSYPTVYSMFPILLLPLYYSTTLCFLIPLLLVSYPTTSCVPILLVPVFLSY